MRGARHERVDSRRVHSRRSYRLWAGALVDLEAEDTIMR